MKLKTTYFMDHIDKIYYINLEHRTDRKESILNQLRKIDPNLEKTERVEAVKKENGCIGCTLSHIRTLKDAIKNNYEQILIFEDDFEFTVSNSKINDSINHLVENHENFNICLLSGNIIRTNRKDGVVKQAINVQTTSGYMVHKRFFETLLENYTEGYNLWDKKNFGNQYKNTYCLDMYWKKLQGADKEFYIFTPKLGKQINSYSDIEKTVTNYNC